MSKPERRHPYNFGRVFFPNPNNPHEHNPIPTQVLFQPLGNHVRNVMRLVQNWKLDDFPGSNSQEHEASQQRVLQAAKIHDVGKPQKFELQVATTPQGKFKEYIYSFRGHRFLASSPDAWVQALARGHHDFSVGDISRDAYSLKKVLEEEKQKQKHYADILSALASDPLTYARELYILEMCDQIEAELACRVIGDEQQAESRTFMDYTITKDDSEPGAYWIDPWPFSANQKLMELTFEHWSMRLSGEDRAELQKCLQGNRDTDLGKELDRIAKHWWQSQQGQPEKQTPRKARLKPYPAAVTSQTGDCQFWYQQLIGFDPNPMQAEMFDAITNHNPAILLKSPTGSGKLESVLFPALAKGYRLFLPLPARSLLEDQKQRVEKYLKQFSKLQPGREVSLVVDTGSQMRRWVYRNGEEINLRINSQRHLYKGDVI